MVFRNRTDIAWLMPPQSHNEDELAWVCGTKLEMGKLACFKMVPGMSLPRMGIFILFFNKERGIYKPTYWNFSKVELIQKETRRRIVLV